MCWSYVQRMLLAPLTSMFHVAIAETFRAEMCCLQGRHDLGSPDETHTTPHEHGLILAPRLFLHTANNALLGTNSLQELILNITSGSVKQPLKAADSVYPRLHKMTTVVSVLLDAGTHFSCSAASEAVHTPLCIHHLKHSNTQHDTTLAQMTLKCNGDVLRLQNKGGGTQIQMELKYATSNTCSVQQPALPPHSSHFQSCQSCTRMLFLLLTHQCSGERSPLLLPKSAPSAPKPVATIRSIYFLFNTYHVVFSF